MFEGKRTDFSNVTPCILLDGNVLYEPPASIFYPEDGSSTSSRNIYKRLSKQTASHHRRPWLWYSWEKA